MAMIKFTKSEKTAYPDYWCVQARYIPVPDIDLGLQDWEFYNAAGQISHTRGTEKDGFRYHSFYFLDQADAERACNNLPTEECDWEIADDEWALQDCDGGF